MKTREFLKKYVILIVLVALIIFFSIATGGIFIKIDNLFNVARQVSINGITSVGIAFCIIIGATDLTVGSMQGLIGVVTALFMVEGGAPIWAAILLALAIGALAGVFHGTLYNYFDIPPMVFTLAMYTSYRGLAYVISGGKPVFGFDERFAIIGQGYIGPIPIPVIIMAIVIAFGWFILNKTSIGKHIYGLGGNPEACRLSGVNVKALRYFVYITTDILASISAIVLLSRVNSGQPKAGTGFEFECITAVVLGGVSVSGGQGNIWGVLIGVLIMGILKNGFVLMNVNEYLQMVFQGFILLAAVVFDSIMNKPQKLTKEQIAATAGRDFNK